MRQRRRQWHPTPVPLPGKSHGWRSLVGYSPWGCKESNMTERLHLHFVEAKKESEKSGLNLSIQKMKITSSSPITSGQIGSVQLLSHVRLFATPWTTAHQASLSITNLRSLLKLKSIESMMPFNHLVLCPPILLPPSIFHSIKVLSNESVLCIRWPKYWSFKFSISPFNEYSRLLPLGWTGWISLQSKGLSGVFSNTTVQKHQFFGFQLSL